MTSIELGPLVRSKDGHVLSRTEASLYSDTTNSNLAVAPMKVPSAAPLLSATLGVSNVEARRSLITLYLSLLKQRERFIAFRPVKVFLKGLFLKIHSAILLLLTAILIVLYVSQRMSTDTPSLSPVSIPMVVLRPTATFRVSSMRVSSPMPSVLSGVSPQSHFLALASPYHNAHTHLLVEAIILSLLALALAAIYTWKAWLAHTEPRKVLDYQLSSVLSLPFYADEAATEHTHAAYHNGDEAVHTDGWDSELSPSPVFPPELSPASVITTSLPLLTRDTHSTALSFAHTHAGSTDSAPGGMSLDAQASSAHAATGRPAPPCLAVALVYRAGAWQRLPVNALVRGDVIALQAVEKAPCDVLAVPVVEQTRLQRAAASVGGVVGRVPGSNGPDVGGHHTGGAMGGGLGVGIDAATRLASAGCGYEGAVSQVNLLDDAALMRLNFRPDEISVLRTLINGNLPIPEESVFRTGQYHAENVFSVCEGDGGYMCPCTWCDRQRNTAGSWNNATRKYSNPGNIIHFRNPGSPWSVFPRVDLESLHFGAFRPLAQLSELPSGYSRLVWNAQHPALAFITCTRRNSASRTPDRGEDYTVESANTDGHVGLCADASLGGVGRRQGVAEEDAAAVDVANFYHIPSLTDHAALLSYGCFVLRQGAKPLDLRMLLQKAVRGGQAERAAWETQRRDRQQHHIRVRADSAATEDRPRMSPTSSGNACLALAASSSNVAAANTDACDAEGDDDMVDARAQMLMHSSRSGRRTRDNSMTASGHCLREHCPPSECTCALSPVAGAPAGAPTRGNTVAALPSPLSRSALVVRDVVEEELDLEHLLHWPDHHCAHAHSRAHTYGPAHAGSERDPQGGLPHGHHSYLHSRRSDASVGGSGSAPAHINAAAAAAHGCARMDSSHSFTRARAASTHVSDCCPAMSGGEQAVRECPLARDASSPSLCAPCSPATTPMLVPLPAMAYIVLTPPALKQASLLLSRRTRHPGFDACADGRGVHAQAEVENVVDVREAAEQKRRGYGDAEEREGRQGDDGFVNANMNMHAYNVLYGGGQPRYSVTALRKNDLDCEDEETWQNERYGICGCFSRQRRVVSVPGTSPFVDYWGRDGATDESRRTGVAVATSSRAPLSYRDVLLQRLQAVQLVALAAVAVVLVVLGIVRLHTLGLLGRYAFGTGGNQEDAALDGWDAHTGHMQLWLLLGRLVAVSLPLVLLCNPFVLDGLRVASNALLLAALEALHADTVEILHDEEEEEAQMQREEELEFQQQLEEVRQQVEDAADGGGEGMRKIRELRRRRRRERMKRALLKSQLRDEGYSIESSDTETESSSERSSGDDSDSHRHHSGDYTSSSSSSSSSDSDEHDDLFLRMQRKLRALRKRRQRQRVQRRKRDEAAVAQAALDDGATSHVLGDTTFDGPGDDVSGQATEVAMAGEERAATPSELVVDVQAPSSATVGASTDGLPPRAPDAASAVPPPLLLAVAPSSIPSEAPSLPGMPPGMPPGLPPAPLPPLAPSLSGALGVPPPRPLAVAPVRAPAASAPFLAVAHSGVPLARATSLSVAEHPPARAYEATGQRARANTAYAPSDADDEDEEPSSRHHHYSVPALPPHPLAMGSLPALVDPSLLFDARVFGVEVTSEAREVTRLRSPPSSGVDARTGTGTSFDVGALSYSRAYILRSEAAEADVSHTDTYSEVASSAPAEIARRRLMATSSLPPRWARERSRRRHRREAEATAAHVSYASPPGAHPQLSSSGQRPFDGGDNVSNVAPTLSEWQRASASHPTRSSEAAAVLSLEAVMQRHPELRELDDTGFFAGTGHLGQDAQVSVAQLLLHLRALIKAASQRVARNAIKLAADDASSTASDEEVDEKLLRKLRKMYGILRKYTRAHGLFGGMGQRYQQYWPRLLAEHTAQLEPAREARRARMPLLRAGGRRHHDNSSDDTSSSSSERSDGDGMLVRSVRLHVPEADVTVGDTDEELSPDTLSTYRREFAETVERREGKLREVLRRVRKLVKTHGRDERRRQQQRAKQRQRERRQERNRLKAKKAIMQRRKGLRGAATGLPLPSARNDVRARQLRAEEAVREASLSRGEGGILSGAASSSSFGTEDVDSDDVLSSSTSSFSFSGEDSFFTNDSYVYRPRVKSISYTSQSDTDTDRSTSSHSRASRSGRSPPRSRARSTSPRRRRVGAPLRSASSSPRRSHRSHSVGGMSDSVVHAPVITQRHSGTRSHLRPPSRGRRTRALSLERTAASPVHPPLPHDARNLPLSIANGTGAATVSRRNETGPAGHARSAARQPDADHPGLGLAVPARPAFRLIGDEDEDLVLPPSRMSPLAPPTTRPLASITTSGDMGDGGVLSPTDAQSQCVLVAEVEAAALVEGEGRHGRHRTRRHPRHRRHKQRGSASGSPSDADVARRRVSRRLLRIDRGKSERTDKGLSSSSSSSSSSRSSTSTSSSSSSSSDSEHEQHITALIDGGLHAIEDIERLDQLLDDVSLTRVYGLDGGADDACSRSRSSSTGSSGDTSATSSSSSRSRDRPRDKEKGKDKERKRRHDKTREESPTRSYSLATSRHSRRDRNSSGSERDSDMVRRSSASGAEDSRIRDRRAQDRTMGQDTGASASSTSDTDSDSDSDSGYPDAADVRAQVYRVLERTAWPWARAWSFAQALLRGTLPLNVYTNDVSHALSEATMFCVVNKTGILSANESSPQHMLVLSPDNEARVIDIATTDALDSATGLVVPADAVDAYDSSLRPLGLACLLNNPCNLAHTPPRLGAPRTAADAGTSSVLEVAGCLCDLAVELGFDVEATRFQYPIYKTIYDVYSERPHSHLPAHLTLDKADVFALLSVCVCDRLQTIAAVSEALHGAREYLFSLFEAMRDSRSADLLYLWVEYQSLWACQATITDEYKHLLHERQALLNRLSEVEAELAVARAQRERYVEEVMRHAVRLHCAPEDAVAAAESLGMNPAAVRAQSPETLLANMSLVFEMFAVLVGRGVEVDYDLTMDTCVLELDALKEGMYGHVRALNSTLMMLYNKCEEIARQLALLQSAYNDVEDERERQEEQAHDAADAQEEEEQRRTSYSTHYEASAPRRSRALPDALAVPRVITQASPLSRTSLLNATASALAVKPAHPLEVEMAVADSAAACAVTEPVPLYRAPSLASVGDPAAAATATVAAVASLAASAAVRKSFSLTMNTAATTAVTQTDSSVAAAVLSTAAATTEAGLAPTEVPPRASVPSPVPVIKLVGPSRRPSVASVMSTHSTHSTVFAAALLPLPSRQQLVYHTSQHTLPPPALCIPAVSHFLPPDTLTRIQTRGASLFTRGDPSSLVAQCTHFWNGQQCEPLSAYVRQQIHDVWQLWDQNCLNVMAFAFVPVAEEAALPLVDAREPAYVELDRNAS